MNRIAELVLKEPGGGGKSYLLGRAGDIVFIVRRDRAQRDRWLLLASPMTHEIATALPAEVVARSTKASRAAAAAAEIIQRYGGDAELVDDISDLWPAESDAAR